MRRIIAALFMGLFLVIAYNADIYAETLNLKKVSFQASGFRNPFKSVLPEKIIEEKTVKITKPAAAVEIMPPEVAIQGIVWGGEFPQAIINGKVLKEGDVLTGPEPITILEIRPKEVVIFYKNKIFNFLPK
jgi:hypothetical protein